MELALLLPVLLGMALLVVQVGLIVRDQVLLVHAAREAARFAAVEGDPAGAVETARTSTGLDRDRLRVEVLVDDPTAELLLRPTNVAVRDGLLYVANLGGRWVSVIDLGLDAEVRHRPVLSVPPGSGTDRDAAG